MTTTTIGQRVIITSGLYAGLVGDIDSVTRDEYGEDIAVKIDRSYDPDTVRALFGRDAVTHVHVQDGEFRALTVTTRDAACAVLADREGTPPEHLDHCTDEALITAANAPEGQPCTDCGALVTWSDERGWRHADPASSCFLA